MRKKNIKTTIKHFFFDNPTKKIRVREMERELKVPLPSVIRYVKELQEEQILTTYKLGKTTYYTSNRGEIYILEKKLYNIKSIYDSGLVEYLKNELSNPAIIVFGSYAKGEDIEESDIDLYIEAKKIPLLKKFEKKLGKPIQIFGYKSIKDINNPHLANNIINGVLLNGYIEVFNENLE